MSLDKEIHVYFMPGMCANSLIFERIKLNKNFIKSLTEKLLLWTGDRWIISLSKNVVAKSVYEKNIEDKAIKITEFKKSKIANEFQKAFPDAKLIDLKEDE